MDSVSEDPRGGLSSEGTSSKSADGLFVTQLSHELPIAVSILRRLVQHSDTKCCGESEPLNKIVEAARALLEEIEDDR